ncbi:MAG: PqqD family protein [Deltaproteobacteria bacterium]|nr:MAG: PqqD family protein [Deltaproteobacteria bacterium]
MNAIETALEKMENRAFCLKDSVLLAVFEDGGVIFELKSRFCHEINRSGAQILHLLDGRKNIDEDVEILAGMLSESKEILRKDVAVFLNDLIRRGWVYGGEG